MLKYDALSAKDMGSLWLHSVIGAYHLIALIAVAIQYYIKLLQDERFRPVLLMGSSFLTIWNFVAVVLVFYGYLIYDVVDVFGWYPKLNRGFKIFVDYCFYSFIAPISLFITIAFWSIWNYDKNLVFGFDGLLEELIPMWQNHILHTVISFLVLIQTYHNKVFFKIRYLIMGAAVYAGCYYAWIQINYMIFNAWPYPLLENCTDLQRHLLINFFIALAFGFIFAFNYLNRKFCLRQGETEYFTTGKLKESEQRSN